MKRATTRRGVPTQAAARRPAGPSLRRGPGRAASRHGVTRGGSLERAGQARYGAPLRQPGQRSPPPSSAAAGTGAEREAEPPSSASGLAAAAAEEEEEARPRPPPRRGARRGAG